MSETPNITLYIAPPSHHFLGDKLFDINTVPYGGDQLMAPWVYLRDFFTSQGIPIHTADYMPPERVNGQNIYISVGNLQNYQKVAKRQDTVLSAFFALECPIIAPSLYRDLDQVQRYFRRIFSWSDSSSLERFVGGPLQLESFCWPQSFERVHETIWSQTERKFLVMINANKLPRVYWQELYTERLRAVEFFSRTGEIDLYGIGWDLPSFRMGKTWMPYTLQLVQRKFLHYWQRFYPDPLLEAARRVYRGRAESKAGTLGSYTFALCFENMILKGWITEKIFDCFFSGTIPIYWGAPDIDQHIPPECFIDMRNFASYEELGHFLRSLSQEDIQKYKENARAYLESPRFYPFSKEAFVDLFRRIVEEDTGIQILSDLSKC